ncbi:MAG: ABC transporter ATP-binding protein [Gammaproteobacteria bacterium]
MTTALSIRNLRKTYDNGVEALKGISLDVAEGDFYALLGPNGAGKSTTIGIITSLVRKTSGTVQVYGKDLDREIQQVKRYIGLVPQEFNFNGFEPVEEIIINQAGFYGIDRPVARERTNALLKELGLWDKRRTMARSLSGGMKRRLMIARALVHRPRLLILDEPTAGVDIELRRSMWDFLRDTNNDGTTIILTTHYLEEAESLCRNIGIIDNGELVENTGMKNILAKLNVETFVLDLKDPVSELPSLPEHAVRLVDEHTIEAEIAREDGVNQLFADLTRHGIEVLSMRNKTNRLEELFLDLVGHSPEDAKENEENA